MKIIKLENKDVYFYLALEEYLIKNTNDNYFFLWSVNNAIVCGKHQNIYEEVNIKYAIENNIAISRRLSGGGTVYQDSGNVNFTFILNKPEGKQIDFKKHIEPVYLYLKSLNINVKYSKTNDLFINNKKISGNAEHVYKNRVLHHGTLLFNSNLHILNTAIKTKQLYQSKAIKSVNKHVTNISDYVNNMSIEDFTNKLHEYIKKENSIIDDYVLSSKIISEVDVLSETKYKTLEWIYNYSPKFSIKSSISQNNNTIEFEFFIENGIIAKSYFTGNVLLSSMFLHKEYNITNIRNIIENEQLDEKLQINKQKLLYCFF